MQHIRLHDLDRQIRIARGVTPQIGQRRLRQLHRRHPRGGIQAAQPQPHAAGTGAQIQHPRYWQRARLQPRGGVFAQHLGVGAGNQHPLAHLQSQR